MSSRASSRSSPSPSASKGSSAINLGKDSGVNMGAKSQTSASSGGIGITQEIGEIGGVGIAGGVSVELSPIGINISGDPNYEDPSKSTISISGGAEAPGGIIGIGGGVTINTSTGAIEGGSIGGEALGLGINISKGKGGTGIGFSLQIPFTPIEIELGFEFPNEKTPTPSPSPTPTPSPSPVAGGDDKGFGTDPSTWPTFKPNCHYIILMLLLGNEQKHEDCLGYGSGDGSFGYSFKRVYKINSYSHIITGIIYIPNVGYRLVVSPKTILGSVFSRQMSWIYIIEGNLLPVSQSPNGGAGVAIGETIISTGGYVTNNVSGRGNSNWAAKFQEMLNFYNNGRNDYTSYKFVPLELCPDSTLRTPIYNIIPLPSASLSPSPSPPFPNPPPRKNNMDECCRESVKLLRELRIYHRESLRLLGRPLSRNGLGPITAKGFFPEETERIKTPINPKNPNEKIKIKFTNYYQLANYFLDQLIKEDVANDPRSFKRPTGLLQNPNYNRDSGSSLTDNKQPEKDKSGNQRELELDKEIYIQSALQQQQYIFEALRRLEYLFPTGELNDAKIAKSLLIPGAKGDIKIHNMIQFQELFVQYINATLGDPRQILTIKDANPALAGDQPIEVSALTIADWARQITKFQIDTAGDVDAAVNLMLRDFRTNMANRTDIVKIGEIAQALFEDTGMREQQEYIPLHLEGDPYAGQWIKGQGFKSNPDLEKKTEEATEKVLQATLNPTNIKVKVSRRHKEEKTDMRDLLRGLADFTQRLLSIPTGGDAAESINKLIESAKFKIQTDAALLRQNISKAATASRNRTRKRKK